MTSIALGFCKARLKTKLAKEQARLLQISVHTAGSCMHPADQNCEELPQAIRLEVAKESLRLGVRSGQISTDNASVMRMIIDRKMSAPKIADTLGITRGAVYQRINRVLKVTPKLIAKIEMPMS